MGKKRSGSYECSDLLEGAETDEKKSGTWGNEPRKTGKLDPPKRTAALKGLSKL